MGIDGVLKAKVPFCIIEENSVTTGRIVLHVFCNGQNAEATHGWEVGHDMYGGIK